MKFSSAFHLLQILTTAIHFDILPQYNNDFNVEFQLI